MGNISVYSASVQNSWKITASKIQNICAYAKHMWEEHLREPEMVYLGCCVQFIKQLLILLSRSEWSTAICFTWATFEDCPETSAGARCCSVTSLHCKLITNLFLGPN